jgi:NAD(P)H-dependent FMN reductase
MRVLGFLGSPHVNGRSAKLLKKALEGAASAGAEIKEFDLIKMNIKYCTGCSACFLTKPELKIGKCSLKDDAPAIFEEYVEADGYIYASPVYDMFITALMKTFLERKIMLTYRPREAVGKIPDSRCCAYFKKKASIIVTGNCADEYREVMGDPCFEAYEGHFMIEQIDTVDKMYCGSHETLTEEEFNKKLDEAFQMGVKIVQEIAKAQ